MASSTMKIKLAVDRSRNRVLFADAGSDFVDVLLTFLTLPLSALQFCSAGAPLPGCLSNLCDSVSRLRGSKLLKVEACHGMLLTPSTGHELGCSFCYNFSTFVKNQPNLQVDGKLCNCWPVMARLAHVYKGACSGSGTFVRHKERFVISNDWTIKSASTGIMQSLPHNFSPDAIFHGFEEVEVCVGWTEVVSLLKASLSSDATFTDVFLPKRTGDPAAPVRVIVNPNISQCNDSGSGSSPERKIKIFYDRQEKKVMYAECKREFVDLLLGFLTYPLGCVIKNTGTGAACHLGSSFNNLYSSAADLDAAGYITAGYGQYPVETLLNPALSPFNRGCYYPTEAVLEQEDQLCLSLAPQGGNLKKTCQSCHRDLVEERTYVVDDDLLVHQASAMSVAKHWYLRDKANVVEMDVAIGKPEAAALLRAMLTSNTVLTDVFIGKLTRRSHLP